LQVDTIEGFDPGSERTLAAWIRHASRTNPGGGNSAGGSGERGSNAWVTYPEVADSLSNDWVIRGVVTRRHHLVTKEFRLGRGSRDISLLVG